ncbi:hypothetical protein [Chitinophaga sp.]|uniref:hypothetical protein n=1 Tax=Chitinophaga sp. TaxID=1869181 RepID=UPI0031D74212
MNYKIVLLACTLALSVACNKDKNEVAQVWLSTPEQVYSFVGKDWSVVQPAISNKKDYLYAELDNQQVKSYVEVKGIDTAAPAQHYKLSFNVGKDNKITSLIYSCTDQLDKSTGSKNFIYFYEHAALKMTGVTQRHQWVQETYNPQQMITPDSLLVALHAGSATQPFLDWYTDSRRVGLVYFSTTGEFRMELNGY